MSFSIVDDRGYNQGFLPSLALKTRTENRCDRIIANIASGGKLILEIGCGTGYHAQYIASKLTKDKVIATDLCKPFIDSAKANNKYRNLTYQILDFNNADEIKKLIAVNGRFDYIIGDGILHHLYPELDETVSNLNKILKPGGKILFWEPNILNPYCFIIFRYLRKFANLEPTEMAFSRSMITRLLNKNKFNNISVKFADFLLPITPTFLISLTLSLGRLLEQIPVINRLSQSIFISATSSRTK